MRIASLLLVSALVTAFGSGCAVDGDEPAAPGGDPGLAPSDELIDTAGDIGKWQTPPIKLRITSGLALDVALIATRVGTPTYHADTEYWFAGTTVQTGFEQVALATLALEAQPFTEETDSAIADWTRPLEVAFAAPRVVSNTDWSRGPVVLPDGVKPHLYWTTSPDDASQILGVVLATGPDGGLAATAWYRNTPPTTSGRAFDSTSWRAALTPVFDKDGNPTADPSYIRDGDWYGIVMKK
jgi:hypothetical protein